MAWRNYGRIMEEEEGLGLGLELELDLDSCCS